MDVSDTTTDFVAVTNDLTAVVVFYRYNAGVFTADGTVATLDDYHKGLNNINMATYCAYFN